MTTPETDQPTLSWWGTCWFERAILSATLLSCALALAPNAVDPDLWGHVQYGRDAIRDGGLHRTTTYSYSAPGYPWINHENLSELVLAAGMDTLGVRGMLILKCLLGVSMMALVWIHALRRGTSLLAATATVLLVSVNLSHYWSMRPQLASFVCCFLMLALLTWCFRGWEGTCQLPWWNAQVRNVPLRYDSRRLRWLWLAVPLFVLWANSHGGFVAGLALFATYLGCRGGEAWIRNGRASFGLLRRLAMMIAAAGLATLLNPYGPRLHGWLLQSLSLPRPEITEWGPPDLMTAQMLPFWLITAAWVTVLLSSRRSRDTTHLVLLLLTFWQAATHFRHIPFFAIPFGFWMAEHVDATLRRIGIGRVSLGSRFPARAQRAFAVPLVLALGLLTVQLYGRFRDLPVRRAQYPVDALQYITDHQLSGRMVVTYNWAQYVIAAIGRRPDNPHGVLVSFDGRFRTCYPQWIVDANFDFTLGKMGERYRGEASGEFDDERVLQFGRPNLVLIDRTQPHSVNVMFRNGADWTLLFQNKHCQLWGRASQYGNPDSPDFIPLAARSLSETLPDDTVTWPALPRRKPDQIARRR